MALLSIIALPDEDKLQVLRRLDQFRAWRSLEDKRYCLACAKIITGRDIQVIGGSRGNGPLRIICPTARCNSIPMDWVLPTDEVLARSSVLQSACADGATVSDQSRSPKHRFSQSVRKFASHFRGSA